MKKYIMDDLLKIKKKYNANFDRLLKFVGTDDHKKYLKAEYKLFREEIKIMVDLGIMAISPCKRPDTSSSCERCTGYFKRTSIGEKGKFKYTESTIDDKNAVECITLETLRMKAE